MPFTRTCKHCGQDYTSGTYGQHRLTHPEGLTYRRTTDLRPKTCKMCGETYIPGQYKEHYLGRHPAHMVPTWLMRHPAEAETLATRDTVIVTMLRADPNLRLEDVGALYGLTRERVRQIWFRTTGTSARRRPNTGVAPRVCTTCGETYPIGKSQAHFQGAQHGQGERHYKRNREWVRLYTEEHLSSVQIGRLYHRNASYVGSILRKHNVAIRPLKGGIVVRKTHLSDG